jgi:hypothetical protein
MSLNYDLTEIKDWQKLNPMITQAIVFATMFVGMGHITEENAPQFSARLDAWQKLHGCSLIKAAKRPDGTEYGKRIPMTINQVRRYIGLRTNVGLDTPSQFGKRLIGEFKKTW